MFKLKYKSEEVRNSDTKVELALRATENSKEQRSEKSETQSRHVRALQRHARLLEFEMRKRDALP